MQKKAGLLFFALTLLLALTSTALAGDWFTIDTPHFQIHYQEGYEEVAKRAALVGEEIYPLVTEAIGHVPTEKTQVVLKDTTDSANGFSRWHLFNGMTLYLTPGTNRSVLGSGFAQKYDDWLYSLMLHEFVHVLHLDMNGGPSKAVRSFAGKVPIVTSLNTMQSFGWIEGLAVYHESHLATGGRSQDPLFRMFLRANVLDDNLPKVDQFLGYYDLKEWRPAANTYLYGSALLEYIAFAYGPESIQKINSVHSSQPFPSLGLAINKVLGKSLIEIWDEASRWIEHREEAVLAQVRNAGVVRGERITNSGERTLGPTFLPSGELVYQASGRNAFPGIYQLTSDNEMEMVVSLYQPLSARVHSSPDGDELVFTETYQENSDKQTSELILYDRNSDDKTRLTTGGRVTDPAFSPDGNRIVYVALKPFDAELIIYDRTSRTTQVIPTPEEVMGLSGPVFSPDGTQIAVAALRKGGWQDLAVVKTDGSGWTWLTSDRAADMSPVWSDNGNQIFYSSDRTGIYNIYALDLKASAHYQITRVLTGAFQPAVSPDGKVLAYSGYTSEGYDIYVLELDQALWKEVSVEQIPYEPELPESITADLGETTFTAREYSPWQTLAPKYLIPFLEVTDDGASFLVSTYGQDALERRSYSLETGWDFTEDRLLADLSYKHLFAEYGPNLELTYTNLSGDQELGASLSKTSGRNLVLARSVGAEVAFLEDGTRETDLVYQAGLQYRTGNGPWSTITGISVRGEEGLDSTDRAIVGSAQTHLSYREMPKLSGKLAAGYGEGKYFQLGGSDRDDVFFLRGLQNSEDSGDRTLTASLSWRPLEVRIERGYSDIPAFVNSFALDLFLEGAGAGYGEIGEVNYFAGVEASLPINLLYGTGGMGYTSSSALNLIAGYSIPVSYEGEGHFYFSASLPLLGF